MKETKNAMRLVGLKLKGQTTNQNNQSSRDCGNLWQQFEAERLFERIPGKLSPAVYAVYYDYESDENGPFSYFIGCQVANGHNTPAGLEELIVPAQTYRKITARGVMTGCITDAWKHIWASDFNRAFGFDFEVYDERSHDWSDAEVDIFVSI